MLLKKIVKPKPDTKPIAVNKTHVTKNEVATHNPKKEIKSIRFPRFDNSAKAAGSGIKDQNFANDFFGSIGIEALPDSSHRVTEGKTEGDDSNLEFSDADSLLIEEEHGQGTFCNVIKKQLITAQCPLPKGSCFWKHRITGFCKYKEGTTLTIQSLAALVGEHVPEKETVENIRNSLLETIRQSLHEK